MWSGRGFSCAWIRRTRSSGLALIGVACGFDEQRPARNFRSLVQVQQVVDVILHGGDLNAETGCDLVAQVLFDQADDLQLTSGQTIVCTENSVRIDYVTESPNVSGDDRSVLPLPGFVRLAVQVEEPT
jgi:hypothetical protein